MKLQQIVRSTISELISEILLIQPKFKAGEMQSGAEQQ